MDYPAVQIQIDYQIKKIKSSFISEGALIQLSEKNNGEEIYTPPKILFPYMNLTSEGLSLRECNINISKRIAFGKDYDGIQIFDSNSNLDQGETGYSDLRIVNDGIWKTLTDENGWNNKILIYNLNSFIPIPQIQYGSHTFKGATEGGWQNYTITFAKKFSEVPMIVISEPMPSNNITQAIIAARVENVSETGFTLHGRRSNQGSLTINWIALSGGLQQITES